MSKRKSGILCPDQGSRGSIEGLKTPGGHNHPLNGAVVALVSDRHSGLLVELLAGHGFYRAGDLVQIGAKDFQPY